MWNVLRAPVVAAARAGAGHMPRVAMRAAGAPHATRPAVMFKSLVAVAARPRVGGTMAWARLDGSLQMRARAGGASVLRRSADGQQGSGAGSRGKDGPFFWRVIWIPASAGFLLVSGLSLRKTVEREKRHAAQLPPEELLPWQVTMMRMFPLRMLSRAWGRMHSHELPVWARAPLYRAYGWLFRCAMDEVELPLEEYTCLQDFFTRHLVPGARPIDAHAPLVAPADARVVSVGEACGDTVEQVKGVTYSLAKLLAMPLPAPRPGHRMWHLCMYLAPGDYHRFHAPADVCFEARRHIVGDMFSVSAAAVRWLKGLFALNERVVLTGAWEHGFIAYTAVAATNVGNVSIAFDDGVHTNLPEHDELHGHLFGRKYTRAGKSVEKGGEVGCFHLGSSIVLVFEAPEGMVPVVEPGQYVQVGQPIVLRAVNQPVKDVAVDGAMAAPVSR